MAQSGMSVSPNVLNQAVISATDPRPGSCWTIESLQELVSYLRVQVVESGQAVEMKASSDPNNLSTVAGDGGIFTQAGLFHQEIKTFVGTQLTFTGWSSAIDATTCSLNVFAVYDATEVGVPALASPGPGAVNIRPTVEIVSIASNIVVVTVRNNSEDCSVTLQLWQPATPVT
jgi:hypothetical protein